MADLNRRALAGGLLAGAALAGNASAQGLAVDEIVTAAADVLRAQYVDPQRASELADFLLARLRAGAYATSSRQRLAELLTQDLRAQTHDLHLSVAYEPPVPDAADASKLPEEAMRGRTTGLGVQTVARLQGNIGLLKVTHFPSPPEPMVSAHYAAAMQLLQYTTAMVLDLTINHGGGSDTYAYFLSYFLDPDIELGRLVWRNDPVEIVKTVSNAPGPHYGATRPIFVAISGDTFSAGEAAALHLKRYGRATLVGQRTRGGAHAGNFFDLPDHFRIFVVMGRGDGPDWEGTGVAPDVVVNADQAVARAYDLALAEVLRTATDPVQAQIIRNVQANSIENFTSFRFERGRRR